MLSCLKHLRERFPVNAVCGDVHVNGKPFRPTGGCSPGLECHVPCREFRHVDNNTLLLCFECYMPRNHRDVTAQRDRDIFNFQSSFSGGLVWMLKNNMSSEGSFERSIRKGALHKNGIEGL